MLNSCQLIPVLRDEVSKVSVGVMSSDKKQGLTEKFHYQYLPSHGIKIVPPPRMQAAFSIYNSLVNTVVT